MSYGTTNMQYCAEKHPRQRDGGVESYLGSRSVFADLPREAPVNIITISLISDMLKLERLCREKRVYHAHWSYTSTRCHSALTAKGPTFYLLGTGTCPMVVGGYKPLNGKRRFKSLTCLSRTNACLFVLHVDQQLPTHGLASFGTK